MDHDHGSAHPAVRRIGLNRVRDRSDDSARRLGREQRQARGRGWRSTDAEQGKQSDGGASSQ
jgi:hypothetical protein